MNQRRNKRGKQAKITAISNELLHTSRIIMEENKQAKRSYRRNKPVTKSKVYAIRLDIDLVDFVREQPNMSKFINELIRKEKENTQKYE